MPTHYIDPVLRGRQLPAADTMSVCPFFISRTHRSIFIHVFHSIHWARNASSIQMKLLLHKMYQLLVRVDVHIWMHFRCHFQATLIFHIPGRWLIFKK